MSYIVPSRNDNETLPTREEVLELRDRAKQFLALVDRYCRTRRNVGDYDYYNGLDFLNNLIFLDTDDTVTVQRDVEGDPYRGIDSRHYEITFPLSDLWTFDIEALEEEVAAKNERERIACKKETAQCGE